jgi:hypothetical protein
LTVLLVQPHQWTMPWSKIQVQISRFTRLCALTGVLLYPFLAALHSATDEAHLLGPHHPQLATPGSAAASEPLHLGDHKQGHAPAERHGDQLCAFCTLAGVTLLAAAEHVAVPSVTGTSTRGCSGAQYVGAHERLNIGHPVRAPPRVI